MWRDRLSLVSTRSSANHPIWPKSLWKSRFSMYEKCDLWNNLRQAATNAYITVFYFKIGRCLPRFFFKYLKKLYNSSRYVWKSWSNPRIFFAHGTFFLGGGGGGRRRRMRRRRRRRRRRKRRRRQSRWRRRRCGNYYRANGNPSQLGNFVSTRQICAYVLISTRW